MITTKCVTVMSSSPEEESGFLDCPLEDVTFRLRTDAWAEGTLIWCSNTRIERDLEFWNWEGIHGFISLTLSIGLLRRNSITSPAVEAAGFYPQSLLLSHYATIMMTSGMILFPLWVCSGNLLLTNHPGLPGTVQILALKFPYLAKNLRTQAKRNIWSPTNTSPQYLVAININYHYLSHFWGLFGIHWVVAVCSLLLSCD